MTHDVAFLADVLPDDRVSFGDGARESHAADWAAQEAGTGVKPDAVVWPGSTEDVSAVLAAANDRGVPVTPYAAGTSLEGNAVPEHRGVSMDLTRMDDVLAVRPDDLQVDVEPGVFGGVLDDAVAEHGLFFPPLPSSGDISTIGGMIANDASGMGTVKYGEVGDWVLGLEAVLADGTVVETGSRARKTSSGYNLTDLLVGSEGTLGVVTRATLELAGIPEQKRGGRAVFQDLEAAAGAVTDAVASGVDVAKIELVDALSARVADDYLGTDLPDAPMVFLEFHADHGVDEEVAFCRAIFEDHGVESFEMADEERMADLWAARRELAVAIQAWDPDLKPVHPGDVTVPVSEMPDLVRHAKAVGEEYDAPVPCFGHAGDGNVHYSVLVDTDDPDAVERGEAAYGDIVERAIEMGGTATGEHGVGRGKRRFMQAEHGDGAVEAMRAVKRALDPRDTLNPGKVFPETADGERVRAETPGEA
jgi:D-lactate dehydrogenase (cytochrome)